MYQVGEGRRFSVYFAKCKSVTFSPFFSINVWCTCSGRLAYHWYEFSEM